MGSILEGQLKPHQIEGVRFMYENLVAKRLEYKGCVLAHSMGLGKTLQVIALIHTLFRNPKTTKVKNVLLVVPANVLSNWECEFEKWIGEKVNKTKYTTQQLG